jgi:antitoxin component of MazEF toxin-antitoxin module
MKLPLRRIGNSLGVIVPKSALMAWGVSEGDTLELAADCIRPRRRERAAHARLDELKRRLGVEVVSRFPANQIRAQSLANLHRWKRSGAWVSAYDEWEKILTEGSDGELFASILGNDDRSNRLRQSPPYVGLLPREEVERLNEEASA